MVLNAFGVQYHTATVSGAEQLTPRMRRVWLNAPTLLADIDIEPTAWLRMWFPDNKGSDAEFQRGYTIAEVDPDSPGRFAVDFVLHEPAGPASAWAVNVTGGETIEVTSFGSRGFSVSEDPPAGYLLIGDSASVPAINTILAAVPHQVAVEVYLEQHHDDDLLIPLVHHPLARVHWVPRTSEETLAAALEVRDWSNWYAWMGPESKALKHLRARVKEFGFPKTDVYAQAYWVHGRAMGKERGAEERAAAAAGLPAGTAESTALGNASDSAVSKAPAEAVPEAAGVESAPGAVPAAQVAVGGAGPPGRPRRARGGGDPPGRPRVAPRKPQR
ncbi:siderophore-interacting protein [Nocardia carnea]|uniref:siderophore-interacting protein n=1 Tax=Nocardia carnea TaxID=37328 RepID=UPI002458FA18|nr:SIP domain-containing protein [Nocardia carnea]